MTNDDESPRPAAHFEIGQPLDLLSVAELEARIEALQQEIARLEEAIKSKRAAGAAAEAFFRK